MRRRVGVFGGRAFGVCPYCGNKYNFAGEKSEALTLALNRANEMRAACDFDDAIREYKLITRGNPRDAEAWWGLALSIYGIEYVRDSRTGTLVPTCPQNCLPQHIAGRKLSQCCKIRGARPGEVYRERAKVIDRLQRAIILRQREEEGLRRVHMLPLELTRRAVPQGSAPLRAEYTTNSTAAE